MRVLLAPVLLGMALFALALVAAAREQVGAAASLPPYAQRRDCDEFWYEQPEDPPVRFCWQELALMGVGQPPAPGS